MSKIVKIFRDHNAMYVDKDEIRPNDIFKFPWRSDNMVTMNFWLKKVDDHTYTLRSFGDYPFIQGFKSLANAQEFIYHEVMQHPRTHRTAASN